MDNELVKKASSIIEEIRTHQKTNTDRLSGLDRQIQDMKMAQKMLAEAQNQPKPVTTVTGPEDALSMYVLKDGVQWGSERNLRTPGR